MHKSESVLVLVALAFATGCFASHYPERPDEPDDLAPGLEPEIGCVPGEIRTRWLFEWEGERPRALAEHGGAFYLVYGEHVVGRQGRVEQIDARGRRTVVGSIPRERHVTRYEWLDVGGALWLARWFGPYGDATQTLEAGPVDPVRGYAPAFSITTPRGIRSVTALDPERLLVVINTVDDPGRNMIVGVDGSVLRSPMPFEPDIGPTVFPSPDGPPYLVRGSWDGEEPREMTVQHLDEVPRTIETEPCGDASFWSCSWNFLALGDEAFLVGRSTPSITYLERHDRSGIQRVPLPAEEGVGHLRRAPGGTVLRFTAPALELLDAETLAPLGAGEFVSGEPMDLGNIRLSEVSTAGRFVALVHGDDPDGEPVARVSLGRICPVSR